MTTLTISLPEDRVLKLKETANRLGIEPEMLVRASIEELLNKPEAEFAKAIEYILKKNADLFRRLA